MRFTELPDTLTIVLGTRGSMPILTRVCMKCHADDPENFEDIAREVLPTNSLGVEGEHNLEDTREKRTNYTVECKSCGHKFILQVRSYINKANAGILHHVYELSEDGVTDYGQLGHFVSLQDEE